MKFSRYITLLVGLLLLTQFNNCGDSTPDTNMPSTLLSACDPATSTQLNDPNYVPNTNCALADQQDLMINPMGGDQNISAGQADFDVSGTCNGSGYVRNVISWQLELQNVMVRSSAMIYNGQSWNTQCINGQFIAYVFLGPITEDNNDRTGLWAPSLGIRSSYTLVLTITGFDQNGAPYVNIVNGIRTINLNPM